MKQLLFLVGLSLLTSVCMAQRLPQIAVPDSYRLRLAPDFITYTFAGTPALQSRLLKLTPEIVLNAKEIDFKSVSITSVSGAQKASVTLDKETQMATLAV